MSVPEFLNVGSGLRTPGSYLAYQKKGLLYNHS